MLLCNVYQLFPNTSSKMQMWFINRVGEPDNFKCETSDVVAILDTLPQFRFSNLIGYGLTQIKLSVNFDVWFQPSSFELT